VDKKGGAVVTLHEDPDMDAQLARTLIGTYVGGADLGEAIATAQRVRAGDYGAWHDEWDRTATAAQQAAEQAARKGLSALAGHAYLRASEYSRQSYFFLRHDLSDERVSKAYRRHRDLFRLAMSFLPYSVEPISIAFDPVPLNGYMFRPDSTGDAPRPTALFPGGFDGTCEEMFKYGAHSSLTQGWNAVTWDGPGQGGQLIEHGVTMRPDFEAVLTPVVDWVLERPFVSADALALVGRSLGGYLGPRGVSRERRVCALVADPGQYDFASRFVSMFSTEDWERVLAADPAMDEQLDGFLADVRGREYYGSRMAAMGAQSFGGWLRMLVAYSLEGLGEQISCPTLVTEGEGDFASQSRKLFDALTCEKQFHGFTEAEGAGGHCEGMGQMVWQDAVFSWLASRLED
jgi:pimeloyl-ACP methyl ester carboxylesterase